VAFFQSSGWKIFRTLPPRLAWSCEINMFWDTGQATKHTTRAGEKSKSNSAHLEDCHHSPSIQKPDTTRQATNPLRRIFATATFPGVSFAALMVISARAQEPSQPAQDPLAPKNTQPAPPGQQQGPGASIKVDVNLVVLHTTVLDDRGKFVDGLKQ